MKSNEDSKNTSDVEDAKPMHTASSVKVKRALKPEAFDVEKIVEDIKLRHVENFNREDGIELKISELQKHQKAMKQLKADIINPLAQNQHLYKVLVENVFHFLTEISRKADLFENVEKLKEMEAYFIVAELLYKLAVSKEADRVVIKMHIARIYNWFSSQTSKSSSKTSTQPSSMHHKSKSTLPILGRNTVVTTDLTRKDKKAEI